MGTVAQRITMTRVLLVAALACTFLAPDHAAARGSFTMQCGCPVEWSDRWEGVATFDAQANLDQIVLVNESAVLLMMEIPVRAGALHTLATNRTQSLERSSWIDDLEEVVIAETEDQITIARVWDSPTGDVMISLQHVQVWEFNFYLSVEFMAPEARFVATWPSLIDVLVVGQPVLQGFTPEQALTALGL